MHTPHPLPGILGKNRNPWGQLWGQLFGARCPQIREGRTGDAPGGYSVQTPARWYCAAAKVNGMVNTVDHKKREALTTKKQRARRRCLFCSPQ